MVSLRRFQSDDLERVHTWLNNKEAIKTLVTQRPSFSEEEAADWVRRAVADANDDRKYVILAGESDEPVGYTALYGLSRASGPELGALIGATELHQRGIGWRAEALTLVKAFEEFGVHRVYGEIPVFNEKAKRVVRKLGWRCEETLPGKGMNQSGEPFDCELWSVLPGDFYSATADLEFR